MASRYVASLEALASKNNACFTCNGKGTCAVVLNFNVFVCQSCAAAHRHFQHRVASIRMHRFTREEVLAIRGRGGNAAAKASWYATLPASFVFPVRSDPVAIRGHITNTFKNRSYYQAAMPALPSTTSDAGAFLSMGGNFASGPGGAGGRRSRRTRGSVSSSTSGNVTSSPSVGSSSAMVSPTPTPLAVAPTASLPSSVAPTLFSGMGMVTSATPGVPQQSQVQPQGSGGLDLRTNSMEMLNLPGGPVPAPVQSQPVAAAPLAPMAAVFGGGDGFSASFGAPAPVAPALVQDPFVAPPTVSGPFAAHSAAPVAAVTQPQTDPFGAAAASSGSGFSADFSTFGQAPDAAPVSAAAYNSFTDDFGASTSAPALISSQAAPPHQGTFASAFGGSFGAVPSQAGPAPAMVSDPFAQALVTAPAQSDPFSFQPESQPQMVQTQAQAPQVTAAPQGGSPFAVAPTPATMSAPAVQQIAPQVTGNESSSVPPAMATSASGGAYNFSGVFSATSNPKPQPQPQAPPVVDIAPQHVADPSPFSAPPVSSTDPFVAPAAVVSGLSTAPVVSSAIPSMFAQKPPQGQSQFSAPQAQTSPQTQNYPQGGASAPPPLPSSARPPLPVSARPVAAQPQVAPVSDPFASPAQPAPAPTPMPAPVAVAAAAASADAFGSVSFSDMSFGAAPVAPTSSIPQLKPQLTGNGIGNGFGASGGFNGGFGAAFSAPPLQQAAAPVPVMAAPVASTDTFSMFATPHPAVDHVESGGVTTGPFAAPVATPASAAANQKKIHAHARSTVDPASRAVPMYDSFAPQSGAVVSPGPSFAARQMQAGTPVLHTITPTVGSSTTAADPFAAHVSNQAPVVATSAPSMSPFGNGGGAGAHVGGPTAGGFTSPHPSSVHPAAASQHPASTQVQMQQPIAASPQQVSIYGPGTGSMSSFAGTPTASQGAFPVSGSSGAFPSSTAAHTEAPHHSTFNPGSSVNLSGIPQQSTTSPFGAPVRPTTTIAPQRTGPSPFGRPVETSQSTSPFSKPSVSVAPMAPVAQQHRGPSPFAQPQIQATNTSPSPFAAVAPVRTSPFAASAAPAAVAFNPFA